MQQQAEKQSTKDRTLQKLIKIPAFHQKPAFNEIYIKGSRPLPVYIKHSHKVLLKHNSIIIHGLTAAINKAVKLALYLMEEYPYLQQKVFTDSVPTLNIKKRKKRQQKKLDIIEGQKQVQEDQQQDQEQIVKQRAAIHIVLTKAIKQVQMNEKV